MKIKSLAHVSIKTRDLEQTRRFYCEILGCEKAFDFIRNRQVVGFYLKAANNTFIEVFQADSIAAPSPDRGLHHFCFETDSLEQLHQKLGDAGYAPREMMMGADQALQFWVLDPNGLEIEFQQYTEQSAQLTGAIVDLT